MKCVSLSNKQCMTQPTFINLHVNEYSQGLLYCPFGINLRGCVGNCNAHNELSDTDLSACVPERA